MLMMKYLKDSTGMWVNYKKHIIVVNIFFVY